MGEVLADTAPIRQHLGQWGRDGSGGRVELPSVVNAGGQVGDRFKDRPVRSEGWLGVVGEGRIDWDQWRGEGELSRFQDRGSASDATQTPYCLPAWRRGGFGNERR